MTKTLTSTNDLETMLDDYVKETKTKLNYQISFTKIDFPIENKVNAYIVNLYAYEEIPKEIGHWVVVLTKNTNALIYTCFGLYSLGLLQSLGNMGYKNVVFDLTADQPTNSKSCGFYCLRYLIERQWNQMDNYLWFIRIEDPQVRVADNRDESWNMYGEASAYAYDKFNLLQKNIDEKNKSKLRKNNDIYQRTLSK